MARETIQPVISRTGGIRNDEERLEHPAFGTVTVGRCSTSGVHLFGSKLNHHHLVNIQIRGAVLDRSLYSERPYSREIVCEIMMSEAQWAHIISSAGVGDGSPCTFVYRPAPGYQLMEVPGIAPDESMQETHRRQVEERLESYAKEAVQITEEIKALADSGKANKTQLAALHKKLELFSQQFAHNMGYAQECMHEAMEKTVSAGKSEIEAFAACVAQRTGIEAIKKGGVISLPTPTDIQFDIQLIPVESNGGHAD